MAKYSKLAVTQTLIDGTPIAYMRIYIKKTEYNKLKNAEFLEAPEKVYGKRSR